MPEADVQGHAQDEDRHRRLALSLPGRFMRSDKLDYPCHLIDISVESATLTTPVPLHVGEKLIVYLTHLGGLEGNVVRLQADSFLMAISATQRKREKLAHQIPRLIAQSDIPEGDERQYPRVSGNEAVLLTLPDGSTMVCPLDDVSLSGAAIVTSVRPPLGSEVMVDKRHALVVRHHERGIAVQFLNRGFGSVSAADARLRPQPPR